MTEGVFKKVSALLSKPGTTERGEAIAADFLVKKGFRILEKNFRSRHGEIDIVCSDGGTFCFVEVKSRSDFSHGFPEEFVDSRKRKKLTLTALEYIRKKRIESRPMRFDIVAVDLSKGEVMNFIEGAFEEEL